MDCIALRHTHDFSQVSPHVPTFEPCPSCGRSTSLVACSERLTIWAGRETIPPKSGQVAQIGLRTSTLGSPRRAAERGFWSCSAWVLVLFSGQFVALRRAFTLGMTDLRRHRGEAGGIGRPADSRQRLAAIVVGGTAAGKTARIPPVQQTAAIGIPAADRAYLLEEAVPGWLTGLPGRSPASQEQGHNDCPDRHMASHNVLSALTAAYLVFTGCFAADNGSGPEASGASAGAGRQVIGPAPSLSF